MLLAMARSDSPQTVGRRGSRVLPVLLAIAALSALVACRPPAERDGARGTRTVGGSTYTVEAGVADTPSVGAGRIEVVVRKDGEPVDGADVRVTGDMTHAGMQPVLSAAPAHGDGVYVTDEFAFTMRGDWIITVDVTYPDGTDVSDVLSVSVTGGG